MNERSSSPSESNETSEPSRRTRRIRPAALILGVLLGSLVIVAGLLTAAYLNRNPTPLLTREAYEAAAERWDSRGPGSYDLDLELTGNRPSTIHVEVRDRQAVSMVRDGVQPSQRRTWYYWTVPGMMDMIAEELEMSEDPAASFHSPAATGMVQRAQFDPEFGYPAQYDRQVLGTNFEIHWKVTRFQVVSPAETGKK